MARSECVYCNSSTFTAEVDTSSVSYLFVSAFRCVRCKMFALGGSLISFSIMLMLIVCGTSMAKAVNDDTPIVFDFENPADDARWSLNVGDNNVVSQLQNRWCFSTADFFMGKRSLVISNEYNKSVPPTTYVNTGYDLSVVAYTEITLPRGSYDLSFAWKSLGEAGVDGVYVLWESANIKISSSLAGIKPDLVSRALKFTSHTNPLALESSWQTETVTIKSDGLPHRLAFIWINNGANAAAISACIDFIQIAKQSACTKVSNINVYSTIDANRSSVSWSGAADEYEVMCRLQADSGKPVYKGGITSHSTSIEVQDGKYGMYDFFVRGICGTDTGVWVPYRNHLIYAPGCIDFVNLTNDNVKCAYNYRPDPVEEGRGDSDWKTIDESQWRNGVVDRGYQSINSRHTVHAIREMDPRTGYMLPTIPDDEVVSVRLGNWDIGAMGERITYSVVADSLYPIILLKYAVVFQDPNHTHENQPRFLMKIKDDRGETLEFGCGDEDFRPGIDLSEDDGWHKFTPGGTTDDGLSPDIIRWKEWTTIGVRIPEHLYGKKISIMLQTYDCEEGGHFGYAYFTLSCVSASITGIVCGVQEKLELKGPNGFTYEWYDSDPMDPSTQHKVLCRDQVFPVDGAIPKTYYCKCNFVTENQSKLKNCSFVLKANTTPRFPLAACKAVRKPLNCTDNYVEFNNVSAVVDDKDVSLGGLKCDAFEWHITGDGIDTTIVDKSPRVKFPQEGGVYQVSLKAFMTEGDCEDDTTFTYIVPKLETKYTWFDTTICSKNVPFRWEGKMYRTDARDTMSHRIDGGCDSIIYLNLKVEDIVSDTVIDTICQGEVYAFHGQNYTLSGEHKVVEPPKSKTDCVSEHILLLTVIDSLAVAFGELPEVCADDSLFLLPLTVNQGNYVALNIDFDSLAESVGFTDTVVEPDSALSDSYSDINILLPGGVSPDIYNVMLRFVTEHCDTLVVPFSFEVRYPVDVLKQKWNDVIAVVDSAYNGGYQFDGFQWYKDGTPIAGFTASYMYIGADGSTFEYNPASLYSVGLRRKSENHYVRTCSFTPSQHTDLSEYVGLSVVNVGQKVEIPAVSSSIKARWWSVSGQLIAVQSISDDMPFVTAPNSPGVYIVELRSDDGVKTNVPKLIKMYVK